MPEGFRETDHGIRAGQERRLAPLTSNLIEGPNIRVTIGSLDDPEAARPVLQYSIEHTLSWFSTITTLPGKCTEEFITPDLAARFVSHQHPDHDT